jgi:hypothetical protein
MQREELERRINRELITRLDEMDLAGLAYAKRGEIEKYAIICGNQDYEVPPR